MCIRDRHISLLIEIFTELKNHNWSLTDLFLKKNIERLKDYSGSIDDLIYTLNETRIWLYITNQKQWIPNNSWIEQVKSIEDKLSEEIHQSLMQKFVDKNKSEVVQNLNISEKNISVKIVWTNGSSQLIEINELNKTIEVNQKK
mgnify:CR=1 FL=1